MRWLSETKHNTEEEEVRLMLWKERYIEMEITGERKCDIEKKIDLQLTRFIDFC